MATTIHFEEVIYDQGGEHNMDLEVGRSSFYPEDSVYIRVDNKTIIMDRATAKRFVEGVMSVGAYHGFLD